MNTLAVEKRTQSADAVRTAGQLPGVVYGPKQEPISLQVNQLAFEKLYADAGESTIITLTGLGEDIEVLVHDIAFDAARGGAMHVDFYAIERGKELTTDVPLEFTGTAPAEKMGGIVNKVLHEVEVTCRPSVLPQHIAVDLSMLVDLESQITVADLVLPEGVKIENEPTDMVATVSEPEEESADTLTPADVLAEPAPKEA